MQLTQLWWLMMHAVYTCSYKKNKAKNKCQMAIGFQLYVCYYNLLVSYIYLYGSKTELIA